jgi:tryptophan synthase alpha chain
MSEIKKAFQNGKTFIPFITAGDPSIEDTERFIVTMAESGADLIEIGIPFSDPIAEGIVIQEADIRALASGTTTDRVFDMVSRVRKKVSIPLVFMTYLNPVYHYGYDKFFTRCEEVGISGIIIPDLPYEEKSDVDGPAAAHGVELISMIAPTSEDRIRMIAKEAKGFIYVVSSMGVTGMRSDITTDLPSMVRAIREVTETPCAIGFGINTPEQAEKMAGIADGVIVGSAIVKIVERCGKDAAPEIAKYVREMKDAAVRAEK